MCKFHRFQKACQRGHLQKACQREHQQVLGLYFPQAGSWSFLSSLIFMDSSVLNVQFDCFQKACQSSSRAVPRSETYSAGIASCTAHNPHGKDLGSHHILILCRYQKLDSMQQSELKKLSQVPPDLLLTSPLIQREAFIWFYETKVSEQLCNQTLHAGMDPGLEENLEHEEYQKLSLACCGSL